MVFRQDPIDDDRWWLFIVLYAIVLFHLISWIPVSQSLMNPTWNIVDYED